MDRIYVLKPCPFCGGVAELREVPHIPKGTDYVPRCIDPGCPGRSTKKYSVKETAISMWNKRAKE